MLMIIVLAVAALVAVILISAATKPNAFRVQRMAVIKAAPDKIFPLIDGFSNWVSWSPYEGRDPTMRRTYGAIAAGNGASYAWEGNKNVGQGSMETLESVPPSRISIKLDFIKPFEAHNTAEFTLVPVAEGTQVTWAMHGPQSYIGKLMSTFIDMDKMIGRDFERGSAI